MRIAVFGYNFPHWKTQAGITNLMAYGFRPSVIFAQDKKELKVPRSYKRIEPLDLFLVDPMRLGMMFDIPYYVCNHNEIESEINMMQLDLGIVLGARILKPNIIKAFKYGVINLHPGILPDNRGLDNIKWAIIEGISQGVSVHFIDDTVDRGRLVLQETIPVYKDDTLIDIYIRIKHLEQNLMIDSLVSFSYKGISMDDYPTIGEGTYHGAVPKKIDEQIDELFDSYKDRYALRTDPC